MWFVLEMKRMKKFVCLLAVLVLCMGLAVPAFAAENDFVPSIAYKPDPEVVPVVDENGEEHIGVIIDNEGEVVEYVDHGCLMVTPIADVWDEEIEVSTDVEELLVFVYNGLSDGSMKIPYEKHEANLDAANMVIRDLFDARWICEEHGKMVEAEGVMFEITFDLGVVADAQIYVMTYDEDTKEWSPIVKTVNNGDGTVTCTFEHLCAVAFSMPLAATNVPSDEVPTHNVLPWFIVLLLAVVGVVVILVTKNKKKSAV